MTQLLSQDRAWSQIIAKAWIDEEFRARLIEDPRSVLAEFGFDTPEGVEIRVLEDTDKVRHLTIPASPAEELEDEELVGTADSEMYCGFCGWCGRCGCWCRGCRGCI